MEQRMTVGKFDVVGGTGTHTDGNLANTKEDQMAIKTPIPVAKNESKDTRHICRVAIVDARQCLRDALANAFKLKLGISVSVYESLVELIADSELSQSITSVLYQLSAGTSLQQLETNIATLRTWNSEANIILLSDKLTRDIADACVSLEIRGLVSSEYSSGQILVCVSVVEAGLSYIPADIERSVSGPTVPGDDIKSVKLPDLDGMLTPRQQQVMRYIAIGKSNKYIAAELSLCESTVKVHVSELMRRLGATSRTHASYIINQIETQRRELA